MRHFVRACVGILLLTWIALPAANLSAENRLATGVIDDILRKKLTRLANMALRTGLENIISGTSAATFEILNSSVEGLFVFNNELLTNRLVSDLVLLTLLQIRGRAIASADVKMLFNAYSYSKKYPTDVAYKPLSGFESELLTLPYSKIQERISDTECEFLPEGVPNSANATYYSKEERNKKTKIKKTKILDSCGAEEAGKEWQKIVDEIASFNPYEETTFTESTLAALFDKMNEPTYRHIPGAGCVQKNCEFEEFKTALMRILRKAREDIAFLELLKLLQDFKTTTSSAEFAALAPAERALFTAAENDAYHMKRSLQINKLANGLLQLGTFNAEERVRNELRLSEISSGATLPSVLVASDPAKPAEFRPLRALPESFFKSMLKLPTPPSNFDYNQLFHSELVIRILEAVRQKQAETVVCANSASRCDPRVSMFVDFLRALPDYFILEKSPTNNTQFVQKVQLEAYIEGQFNQIVQAIASPLGLGPEISIGMTGANLKENNATCRTGGTRGDCSNEWIAYYHEKLGFRYVFSRDKFDSDRHVSVYVGGILYRLEGRTEVNPPNLDLSGFRLAAAEYGQMIWGLLDVNLGYYYLNDGKGTTINSYGINLSFPLWEYLRAVQ